MVTYDSIFGKREEEKNFFGGRGEGVDLHRKTPMLGLRIGTKPRDGHVLSMNLRNNDPRVLGIVHN